MTGGWLRLDGLQKSAGRAGETITYRSRGLTLAFIALEVHRTFDRPENMNFRVLVEKMREDGA